MRRLAWLIPLFAAIGCGGSGPGATTDTTDDAQMVREMSAQLQQARLRILALGLDEIPSHPTCSGRRPTSWADTPSSWPRTVRGPSTGPPVQRIGRRDDDSLLRRADLRRGLRLQRAHRKPSKIGGRVDNSDDPSIPVGTFIWWQAIDNSRLRRADQSTLTGFGDEAANTAFCTSPNPPRFGPFDVIAGAITVLSG